MAYMLAIAEKCDTLRCPRTVKYEVFNLRHQKVGRYCAICAHRVVAQLSAAEAVQLQRKEA